MLEEGERAYFSVINRKREVVTFREVDKPKLDLSIARGQPNGKRRKLSINIESIEICTSPSPSSSRANGLGDLKFPSFEEYFRDSPFVPTDVTFSPNKPRRFFA